MIEPSVINVNAGPEWKGMDELEKAMTAYYEEVTRAVTVDLSHMDDPAWLSKGEVVGLGIGKAKRYPVEEALRLKEIADLTIDLWITIGEACDKALGEEE